MNPSTLTHPPRQKAASRLGANLRPGRVYRREDLVPHSSSVDRHLDELVSAGRLTRLAQGMYYAPRESSFGVLPPEDGEVVSAFLRDREFLVFSPSAYNAAGLGTTQLYNKTLVYNHKRHGVFKLGSRHFDFRMKPRFPRKLTPEFLFVDALNNMGELAEDQADLLRRAEARVQSFAPDRLRRAAESYGSMATRKRVLRWLDAGA
jgi:hypothetical protein